MTIVPFNLYDYYLGLIPGTGLQVRLYQSGPPFVQFPDLTDFVEAVFPGYVPQPAPIGPMIVDIGNGVLSIQYAPVAFVVNQSGGTGCTAQGWYLTSIDEVGTRKVACWGSFSAPKQMVTPDQSAIFTMQFTVDRKLTAIVNP